MSISPEYSTASLFFDRVNVYKASNILLTFVCMYPLMSESSCNNEKVIDNILESDSNDSSGEF